MFISLILSGLVKSRHLKFNAVVKPVSILVAMRNEDESIINLLNSILNNNYPKEFMEIVIVDDHSTDNCVKLVLDWKEKNEAVSLFLITPVGEGKKNAIEQGIPLCSNDIILQTDADCFVPSNWIATLVAPFENEKTKLVAGPVALTGKSFWQKLQAVEFSSLIASSIGLSNMNLHVMANAANLAYRKSVRLNLFFREKSKSGDDVFFIQNLALRDKHSIVYLSESVVTTSAKATYKAFVQQRLRWASKTLEYPNTKGIWIAVFVLLVNIFTLGALVSLFFMPVIAAAFLIIRFSLDALLLNKYYRLVLKTPLPMGLFFIQSIINPFYILGIGVASQFLKTSWKGREM